MCKKTDGGPDLETVDKHQQVMNNGEVRVIKWTGQNKTVKGGKTTAADGYLQKNQYFVLPEIDSLRKDKIALKKQVATTKGDQFFTRFRIVNGGKEITNGKNIFYVAPAQ